MVLRSLTFAAAVAAALAVGGCTSEAPSPQVASAARPTASTGPAAGAGTPSSGTESDYDKALRFTRCMNALGEHIPDPVVGEPLQVMALPDLPKNGPQQVAVVPSANFAKCKQYLPTTWPVKIDPKELARNAKFSDCMAKHGIPAPQLDAQGMVHTSPDMFRFETPDYRAAEAACQYLLDGPSKQG